MSDQHHIPNRFRENEGQLELFEEDYKEERGARKALAVAIFAILGVAVLLFALPALAGETRTHACVDPQVTVKLVDVLADEGIEQYAEAAMPYLADGTCMQVKLPTPVPVPPFYEAVNGDFRAGGFIVFHGATPYFAILINDIRKHPKFGLPI